MGQTSEPDYSLTQGVLTEVRLERESQDEKWGVQDHPLLSPPVEDDYLPVYGMTAEAWKTQNAERAEGGTLGWDGILLEEVYEAFGESDLQRARQELVQVAAVAVAAIECIDRNAGEWAE